MELFPKGGAVPQVRPGPFLKEPSVPSSRRYGERSHGLEGEAETDGENYLPWEGVGQPERDPRECI